MIIRGSRSLDKKLVLIDGKELTPDASQKVWNHSPDGFEWGYHGSGPAQLALAILLAAGATPGDAATFHQSFKDEVVAKLKYDFEVEIDFAPGGYLWTVKSVRTPLGQPLTH